MKFYDSGSTGVSWRAFNFLLSANLDPFSCRSITKRKIIMRINCILILMVTTLVQVSASTYAQKISLVKTNASIAEIFKEIQLQTDYDFIYSDKLPVKTQKININVKEGSLTDVLDECFKNQHFTYLIKGKTILVIEKKRNTINYEKAGAMVAQIIKGRVVDKDQKPLMGVSVKIAGTKTGAVTDADGRFSFTVSTEGDFVLEFSSIGFLSKTVSIGKKTEIIVVLEEAVAGLDAIVVVGYGTQKKITLTGAISSVGSADLVKSPNASLANTLAGRVTGLTSVQYSGLPGGDDPQIFVRGIGSLSGSNSSPLILVDGVERSFSQLDPNEVESVTVLKDASATAVFGIKGANGVVIVTTKRGTEGTPKITFSANAGFQTPIQLLKLADSYTYATTFNQAQLSDDPNAIVRFTPEAIEAFRTNSDPIIYPNTDWVKTIMKPAAFQTQQNVNISGGTKAVKYFVSLGYLDQGGLLNTFNASYDYNFKYKRYNYRANIDIDVTKTTKISLTTGGRSEVRNSPYFPSNSSYPEALFYDVYNSVNFSGPGIVDGKLLRSGSRYISGSKPDGLMNSYGTGVINSLRNILNFDVALNQKLDFLTEGLSFGIKTANNTRYDQSKSRSTSVAYYEPWYRKDIDPNFPDDNTLVYKKNGEDGLLYYGESYGKARDMYFESSLSYARDFGDHHVTGLLLYNQSKTYYPAVNTDIPLSYLGLVGRATYDFRNKYLLDVSMGYNGSENFAPDRRFGFFPALSLGWILSQEKFMKNLPFVNYLKVRASYGIVGNDKQGSSRFLYLPDSYSANSGGYNFGTDVPTDQIVATEGRVGNPLVTWETSRKQNIGLDMRVFHDKLGLTIDFFDEYRDNILTTRNTVPGFLGLQLPALNIGVVKNRGYEIELKWNDQIGNFGYFINTNMSFSRNKVVFKDEIPRSYDYLMQTGKSVNQPFGYVNDGLWSVEDVKHLSDFPNPVITPKPGDIRYKDLNGDGIINSDDVKPIGYPDYPEYIFGTTMGANFKGFDISFLVTATTHVSRSLQYNYRQAFGSTLSYSLMQYMVDNQWTPENQNATYPRMTLSGSVNNVKDSDFWLKDASYIRLKNAELGYSFNTSGLKRFGITKLRAFVNGYNLLTFDKIKIVDPESSPGGINTYPVMKIFNMGINVVF